MNSFEQFINKLVLVQKLDGRKFISRVFEVDAEWITFQARDGRLSTDRIDSISHLSELVDADNH